MRLRLKSKDSGIALGFVYLFKVKDFDLFKIGRTVNLASRIAELQTGCPYKIHYVHACFSSNCIDAEKNLHRRFNKERTAGEWFALSPKQVQEAIAVLRMENDKALMQKWLNNDLASSSKESVQDVTDFFQDVLHSSSAIKASEAYSLYLTWCELKGIDPKSLILFGSAVKSISGIKKTRTKSGWIYKISLLPLLTT